MCAAAASDPLLDFAAIVGEPGSPVELVPASLAIARIAYPDLDPVPYQAQLKVWGMELLSRLEGVAYPMPRVRRLQAFVFDELGFFGNRAEYYDPRNSFLNDVIERRTGIPISLSVVTMALAAHAGLPISGVGFPGHFLVRYMGEEDSYILFDPFAGGEVLTEADCVARIKAIQGPEALLEPRMVAPVTSRQIIARMLANLKGVYLQDRDHERSLAVVERLLIVDPGRSIEHRDRGMLLLSLQRQSEAIQSLQTYLDVETTAPDAGVIRRLIQEIRQRYGTL